MAPLLKIENVRTYIPVREGIVKAADGVSFELEEGESLGILGESGCGKTTIALSILGLIPTSQIIEGSITFKGKNLLKQSQDEMRRLRGNEMSFILQDPITALNPVITVGDQVAEVLSCHGRAKGAEAWKQVVDMMKMVGIPDADARARNYPHEFSGGMRQRSVIAMALLNNPSLLIVDEATTYLDVTIQAQVLELIRRLRESFGTAVIYISHDLGVIAEMCDKVLVMYAGQPIEYSEITELYKNPKHPYTQGLFSSYIRLDQEDKTPTPLKGNIPNPINTPEVCLLYPRCDKVMDICSRSRPVPTEVAPKHQVYCFQYK